MTIPNVWALAARKNAVNRHKLLYIASLPHSGSTVSSLILGQQPNIIGLGGIDRAVSILVDEPDKASNEFCSCGRKVLECGLLVKGSGEGWHSQRLWAAGAIRTGTLYFPRGLRFECLGGNIHRNTLSRIRRAGAVFPKSICTRSIFAEIIARLLCVLSTYETHRKNVMRPGWMIGLRGWLALASGKFENSLNARGESNSIFGHRLRRTLSRTPAFFPETGCVFKNRDHRHSGNHCGLAKPSLYRERHAPSEAQGSSHV
jgi:hypothetical protein